MGSSHSSQKKVRVVHLLGSATSAYYEGVSTTLAVGCEQAAQDEETLGKYEFLYAVVHPEGPTWSFPKALDEKSRKAAPRVPHEVGLKTLADLNADVCVPHMFCYPGMTSYRGLMDVLGVPFVGCPVDAMSLSTNKAQTKGVVAAAGVPVAPGEVLRRGEQETTTMEPPFILKPCCEDNSMGITVVHNMNEFQSALAEAFQFDSEVLIEKFIPPGREIRMAVVENEDGEPETILPCVEYFLSKDQPIRTSDDKITTDPKTGLPVGLASGGRQCPADIDPVLQKKMEEATRKAHKALGCRDYSLYDFRVDEAGEIYFLEACLYCSFSPKSVIVSMANQAADPSLQHPQLFHTLINRAAARKQVYDPLQVMQQFGMKAQPQPPRAQPAQESDHHQNNNVVGTARVALGRVLSSATAV
mmetsp:Transcript_79260/g.211991  ORF Transcript_79260/g.211991 Transcript_79260/m.211991 type:complete len:415 (-) Transcript_79260:27-1271(-)